MKIFLDAGHNFSGGDTGASGFGLKEQDVTFEIADKLRMLFQNAGYEVKMSRNKPDDNVGNGTVASSITGRATQANNWGADLFISIHTNAYNGSARGTETLVYSLGGEAAEIAKRVQSEIVAGLGTVDRGVKARSDLGVLRMTNMPALLIEAAFIDNEDDAWFLKSRQDDFARAIFYGVTGETAEQTSELVKPNDIVWEYAQRGIVSDSVGMVREMEAEPEGRLYWLARKALKYIRESGI